MYYETKPGGIVLGGNVLGEHVRGDCPGELSGGGGRNVRGGGNCPLPYIYFNRNFTETLLNY